MNISELLAACNAKNFKGNIKLGSKDGAAFFFCGKVTDLTMDKLEKLLYDRLDKRVKNADGDYERHKRVPRTYESYLDYSSKEEYKWSDFQEWLEWMDRELERRQAYSEKVTQQRMDAPLVGTREVIRIYESELEANTIIVIIEGDMSGPFWTVSESERNNKNGKH